MIELVVWGWHHNHIKRFKFRVEPFASTMLTSSNLQNATKMCEQIKITPIKTKMHRQEKRSK